MKKLLKKIEEYNKKIHSKSGIGELYERQIRYLYEKNGWKVIPYGILKGKEDLGRDLICTKGKQVLIIQITLFFISNSLFQDVRLNFLFFSMFGAISSVLLKSK